MSALPGSQVRDLPRAIQGVQAHDMAVGVADHGHLLAPGLPRGWVDDRSAPGDPGVRDGCEPVDAEADRDDLIRTRV